MSTACAPTDHLHTRPSLEAFFSYGFRPFFLGAGGYAAFLMAVWVLVVTATPGLLSAILPHQGTAAAWHAHELVFGFGMAAVAGFLLTAVPNWTGALPISGAPLMALFAIWLSGRIAMWTGGLLPPGVAPTIDAVFAPMLGAFAARQLFTKPAPRNMIFLGILAFMAGANIAYHLAANGIVAIDDLAPIRFALLLIVLMTAIIGGRIVPAFTHNWINVNARHEPMPRRINWLDGVSIASLAGYAITTSWFGEGAIAGLAALVACTLNAARLVLWRGWSARREPIVLILHVGYAWIVLGLALAAIQGLIGGIPQSIVSHAFATGAIGTMILAVMTRASLGHTGRRIVAEPVTVTSYWLITAAALFRVAGPLLAPSHYQLALALAGLAWIGAFVLFTCHYAWILTTPRVHTKIG